MSDKFSKAREVIKEAIKCMSALKSWILCEKLFVLDCVQYLTERFLKICNQCEARENKQPELSVEGYAAEAKRGKTQSRIQARENVKPEPSAGKHTAGAKRGKICSWCQARENTKRDSSAGKYEAGVKRGKICSRGQARENMKPERSAGNTQLGLSAGNMQPENLQLGQSTRKNAVDALLYLRTGSRLLTLYGVVI